jgi:hypothetical protein
LPLGTHGITFCADWNGTVSDPAQAKVARCTAKIVSNIGPGGLPGATAISASPNPIVSGRSTVLVWSGTGSCTGTNFDASAGSPLTISPTSTVTYTVTCNGQPASVTVTVKPKPIFIEP